MKIFLVIATTLFAFQIQGYRCSPTLLDDVGDFTKNLGLSIGDGISGAISNFSGVLTNPINLTGQALNNGGLQLLGTLLSGTGNLVGHSLNNTGQLVNTTAVGSSELVKNALKNTGKVADGVASTLGSVFRNGSTSNPVEDTANFASDLIKVATNDTGNLLGGIVSSLGKIFGDVVGDAGGVLAKTINDTLGTNPFSAMPKSPL